MKYLIAGLGNIGPEYELTRHNIGFLVADQVSGSSIFSSDKYVSIAETKHKGRTIYVIKPTTFMNLSGKAVRYWMEKLKIPIENLMVVTDDINLEFGKIRMRKKGSNGGHNGLGNIESTLGRNDYPRLRVGVGSDFAKGRQIDFVLGNFDKPELENLEALIERCVNAVKDFTTMGIDRAMNTHNG